MYLEHASTSAITEAASQLKLSKDDALVVLLAEKNAPDLKELVAALKKLPCDFIGGVFPGLIHGNEQKAEGAVLFDFPCIENPFVVQHLDRSDISLPAVTAKIADDAPAPCTAVILADGFSANISAFLAELFGLLGNSVHYLGGGAGFSDMEQRPCVFSPEGVFQNAAVVAFLSMRSTLGVRHGWERLYGPVVATKTKCNVISELNWENAFDVYSAIIADDSGETATKKDFSKFSQHYPFGLIKEEAEDVVRDPFSVDRNGALNCIGEIPENTVLNILHGKKDSLIKAAGMAATDCSGNTSCKDCYYLIVDCISRSLYLQDRMKDELSAVCEVLGAGDRRAKPEGVLSIGEISSYGDGFVDFLNKTIVVGALCDV